MQKCTPTVLGRASDRGIDESNSGERKPTPTALSVIVTLLAAMTAVVPAAPVRATGVASDDETAACCWNKCDGGDHHGEFCDPNHGDDDCLVGGDCRNLCDVTTQLDCEDNGGDWLGDTQFPVPHCTFDPCISGSCCVGPYYPAECHDDVSYNTEDECEGTYDGIYHGGVVCDDDPCAPLVDEPCEHCGPGAHWVDDCAEGSDDMWSEALVGLDLDLDCVADTTLRFYGPVHIERSAPLDDSVYFPDTRPVDEHFDVIDTDITQMRLLGAGLTLKAGVDNDIVPPLSNTRGVIAEVEDNPLLAESFFEVFFEIELPSGALAYNEQPCPMVALIDCVPPDELYVMQARACIELRSQPDGGGFLIANLVSASHQTNPEEPIPAVSEWGIIAMTLIALTAGTLMFRRQRAAPA